MNNPARNPERPPAGIARAQLLTEALIAQYIHELYTGWPAGQPAAAPPA
jgi:hypothetical protein